MDFPTRKPNRLPNYSYSQNGCYFLTICTNAHKPILSRITEGSVFTPPTVILTEYGNMVDQQIKSMAYHYPDIRLDHYVIMPNHVHLLVSVAEAADINRQPANNRIPFFVSTLKRFTNKAAGFNLWQRSYHDHVIRNTRDFQVRWNYIDTNPTKWLMDRYYTP